MTGPTPAPREDERVTHVVNNFDLLPHGWRDPFWAGVSFTAGGATVFAIIGIVRTLARAVLA